MVKPNGLARAMCGRGLSAVLIILLGTGTALAADSIVPGEIQTRATWACMGINWSFKGDDNRNAVAAVQFRRKGLAEWRAALPLWVHDFEKRLMFSGSVFRLAPGTEYEFKLTLKDPDGGGVERIVTASTRDYPRLPGRTLKVQGGLAEAQQRATPGTVMRLPPGTYPAAALTVSGKPGEWIVYAPAGDGEVIIEGPIRIAADWVWLHGLTLRSPKTAVLGSGTNNCITSCRINAHYGVHAPTGAEYYFVADNLFTGDAKGTFSFSGEGVDMGSDRGGGHAVCYNEMTDTADGVSYGGGNIDVYGNSIHETVDDFIEPDYARENYRVWDNLCFNSMCGVSFQPMKGGPWYVFNNVLVGNYLHALKVKEITGPTVLYGNTMLTKSARIGQAMDIMRGTLVNNIWARCTPGPLGEQGEYSPGANPTMVDFNAYGAGQDELFGKCDYARLANRNGWDKHSVRIEWDKLFIEQPRVPAGNPRYGLDVHGMLIPEDWKFDHNRLLPRADSRVIDAGTVLPNLTGPFLGKAPDIGAHESGLGTAWTGPRVWDAAAGLVFGVPDGWKQLGMDKASEFASLGCPQPKRGERGVLLAGSKPKAFAMLTIEQSAGEARWKRANAVIGVGTAAEVAGDTPVLEFQDGFYMRLHTKDGKAILRVSRVEPDGVLVGTIGCAKADLPAARVAMFQLARSLFR